MKTKLSRDEHLARGRYVKQITITYSESVTYILSMGHHCYGLSRKCQFQNPERLPSSPEQQHNVLYVERKHSLILIHLKVVLQIITILQVLFPFTVIVP